jgi:hypothetical protein
MVNGSWIYMAIALGSLIICLAYTHSKKNNNGGLTKRLMIYLAPTLMLIAFIELYLVPKFGVNAVNSLYPLLIACWVLPATYPWKRKYN